MLSQYNCTDTEEESGCIIRDSGINVWKKYDLGGHTYKSYAYINV